MERLILLLEDDEISQHYLRAALLQLPAKVITCNTFQEALDQLDAGQFDLIISDIHLSDATLFEHTERLNAHCAVLAITAELSQQHIQTLANHGIAHSLAKPMSIAALHTKVEEMIGASSNFAIPEIWDSQKALNALGQNETAVQQLMAMFRDELPMQLALIERAYQHKDAQAMNSTLHKLKASCGFLGADRLLYACHAMSNDATWQCYPQFLDAANSTFDSLTERPA